jgi:isopentenyl-diphosphate delta-isomerase
MIASGGLRNGIDIAKCIALGADMGGMAGPFLKAASRSAEDVAELIDQTVSELRICMFGAGCGDLTALRKTELVPIP